jgi:tetratricopeptide (TPR) repeat protein
MTHPTDFKYRAFLSYSHADTPLAKGLHSRLESYPLRGLSGRETPLGPVPKQLRPIFRDREDFIAGGSLNEQSIAALDASAALIVLCSPASAKSHYVNEEIRLFKHRRAERPIVPVILSGKPDGGEQECFPPALRFELDAEGQITDRPAPAPLAADVREEGDGRELALAKVAASLIGVPSDEVYRRAERERKRQAFVRNVVAAVILLLTCGVAIFLYLSQQRGAVLIDTAAACASYLPKDQAKATGPVDPRDQCIKSLEALQKGAASDPRDAEIVKLIGQGKTEEAEQLQLAAAQDDEAAMVARGKKAAERYRGIAATAGLADPKKAREYYAKAAKLDPANISGMVGHAFMEREAGNLGEAERAYSAVLGAGVKGKDDDDLYWAGLGLGDIHVARGDLPGALSLYRGASSDAERLAKADPGNARWQYDLGISNERIGSVQMAQGDLAAALKSYEAELDILSRLAKSDPGNAQWQRDLSVSYEKVGDVLVAQGNLPEALKAYRDDLAIAERLAKSDPGNAGWQYDLGVSNERTGDVQMAQGDLAAALKSYEAKRDMISRLAKSDPGNAGWQRDLSVSNERLGDVYLQQGNLGSALEQYRASLNRMVPIRDRDPSNADLQRFTSVTLEKVGDVLKEQGNLPEALKAYRDSLAIRERLAKADPANAQWQVDVAFGYWRLAANGDKPAGNWRKIIDILQRLDGEGRLAPVHKKWLDQAKARLAALGK